MIENVESLGIQFSDYRKRMDISQRKLWKLSGVAQDKISKFENGNPNITLGTLFKLLKALDLKIILVDENDDKLN